MDEQTPGKKPETEPTPDSATGESKLDAAKQKLAALTDKAKEHNFKEDARKAAEGVKNLKESLAKHDFKAELRDAFAETKKNPSSLWKKPETLRPGKDLAVVGLAASVVLLLLLLVTSSSFFGLVCLVLGIGALLFSALGLKTEGRKIAVGGSVVGLLVVLCSLVQMFGSSDDGAAAGAGDIASTNETSTNETSSSMVGSNPKGYPVLVANKGKKTGTAKTIIDNAAENASRFDSQQFYGFYTGMSAADFETLREHYGLSAEQLFFFYNWENGEVYEMCFTPKALNKIMGVPNNFDTVEIRMLEYFEIVSWNNEREIVQGEVDSIFQDDAEKLVFGDKGNVPRKYRTADGVVFKLFPKGWDQTRYAVFDILDTQRQKAAASVKRHFPFTNKMSEAGNKLEEQGIKTKMLALPGGVELLMKEHPTNGRWISEFPLLKWQALSLGLYNSSWDRLADDDPLKIYEESWEIRGGKRDNSSSIKEPSILAKMGKDALGKWVSFRKIVEKLNGIPEVSGSGLVFCDQPEYGGETETKDKEWGGYKSHTMVYLIATSKETIDAGGDQASPPKK